MTNFYGTPLHSLRKQLTFHDVNSGFPAKWSLRNESEKLHTDDASWCFENYLLLNPDKTKLMVFGSWQMICKPLSFKLSFLCNELFPTDSVKDLGVIFDPTLTFDCHISALSSSIRRYSYSPTALGRETSQHDCEAKAGNFLAKTETNIG